MKKSLVILFAIAVKMVTYAATPEIRNVKAVQQYPWDGKVYITYEVVGNIVANAGNGTKPLLFATAKDKTSGRVYETVHLSGDTGTSVGLHKVVWDVSAQGLTINSTNAVFTIGYCDELYLVIDLSSGANSSSYTVSYLYGVPSDGWGDSYKTTKLALRLIPPGSFAMGGSHKVTLTKPFYMGVFEVTQKQYQLVYGKNPSRYTGDKRPVETVAYMLLRGSVVGEKWPSSSTVGSSSFMGKLRARTGLKFDLPTEAQWEYACRARTTSSYNNGGDAESDLKKLGRYYDNASDGKGGYSQHTVVGSYQPNAWGLYDMHGNVRELCLDWYGSLSENMIDPVGPSSGSVRVSRGGSWDQSHMVCSSYYRTDSRPWDYNSLIGFRLVCTLSD